MKNCITALYFVMKTNEQLKVLDLLKALQESDDRGLLLLFVMIQLWTFYVQVESISIFLIRKAISHNTTYTSSVLKSYSKE